MGLYQLRSVFKFFFVEGILIDDLTEVWYVSFKIFAAGALKTHFEIW